MSQGHGHDHNPKAAAIDLAARQQTSIIGAAIQPLGPNEEDVIRGNQ